MRLSPQALLLPRLQGEVGKGLSELGRRSKAPIPSPPLRAGEGAEPAPTSQVNAA